MFELIFTENAIKDIRYLKKSEQVLVLESIEKQLTNEPLTTTINRKPLRPNNLAEWELRIQEFRVFYDTDIEEESVKIKAVGRKEHNKLFIRNREYEL